MYQVIKKIADEIDPLIYGGKAYWSSWLYRTGYKVPYAIFLPGVKIPNEINKLNLQIETLHELLKPTCVNNRYDVAVRSSATCEDTHTSSYAGHFKTIMGQMMLSEVLCSVKGIVQSLSSYHMPAECLMGVIIQKRINARFSGVITSSNPLTGKIKESIVSIISGMGSTLMSGNKKGEDILLTATDHGLSIPEYGTDISRKSLLEIWCISKQIESKLDHPIIIEWCIEEDTNELYILQCRPITGLVGKECYIVPVKQDSLNEQSNSILNNEKISIRILAEQYKIPISPAYLVHTNRSIAGIRLSNFNVIRPSKYSSGYSVVLINPEKLLGKVVRTFSGLETLYDTVQEMSCITKELYWTSTILIQEIYDAEYSGIVKKLGSDFVIEIAKGHFVPKGVVDTSRYVVNEENEITYTREVKQNLCVRIINGKVTEIPIDSAHSLVSIPKQALIKIIRCFAPLLNDESVSVEFGLLRTQDKDIPFSYLIDIIREKDKASINSSMLWEGVISKGAVTGRLVSIKSRSSSEDLNIHFSDDKTFNYESDMAEIIISERPSLSLLKIIKTRNPRKLGFIFRKASILCHLAVILREYGIPAIQAECLEGFPTGAVVTLDANTSGLSAKGRLSVSP